MTAEGVVKRVYTDLAVLDVTPDGFVVLDIADGLTFEGLQERTEAARGDGAATGGRDRPGHDGLLCSPGL